MPALLLFTQFSIRALLFLVGIAAIAVALLLVLFPGPPDTFTPDGYLLNANQISATWPSTPTGKPLPPCSVFWFRDDAGQVVSAVAAFGEQRPAIMASHQHGHIQVQKSSRIPIPQDKRLYILGPQLELHKTTVSADEVGKGWHNYQSWGEAIVSEIEMHRWL